MTQKTLFAKTILALLTTLLLATATAAQTTATPGENTTIETGLNETSPIVLNELPFQVQNLDGNLTAQPSNDITPGVYTGDIELEDGFRETYEVEIPEVANWEIQPGQVNQTIDVGTTEDLELLNATLQGNVRETIETNVTGELEEFVDVDPVFTVFPDIDQDLVLTAQIPSDTQFGEYNGSIEFTDTRGENQTVDLNFTFEDNNPPEIEDIQATELEATRSGEIRVIASDNIGVENVTADFTLEQEVTEANETFLENETLIEGAEFDSVENTDVWTFEFNETSEIGEVYIETEVEDEAGNTASQTGDFDIVELDAVEVLNENFRFEAANPGDETTQEVFELDVETPVNVVLDDINNDEAGNSSFSVGVLKPGDEAPTRFNLDEDQDNIAVQTEGVYELFVESDTVESFDGELRLEPVQQHRDLANNGFVVFDGQFVDPVYPDSPETFSIAEFTGELRFSDSNATVHDEIVFEATAPASTCRGEDSWSNCITGFSLNQIPELEGEMSDVEDRNDSLLWQRNAMAVLSSLFSGTVLLIAVLYVRAKNLEPHLSMRASYKGE